MCRGVSRDAVGDDAVREEPRRDDQIVGARGPQAFSGLGNGGVRTGGERDVGP